VRAVINRGHPSNRFSSRSVTR